MRFKLKISRNHQVFTVFLKYYPCLSVLFDMAIFTCCCQNVNGLLHIAGMDFSHNPRASPSEFESISWRKSPEIVLQDRATSHWILAYPVCPEDPWCQISRDKFCCLFWCQPSPSGKNVVGFASCAFDTVPAVAFETTASRQLKRQQLNILKAYKSLCTYWRWRAHHQSQKGMHCHRLGQFVERRSLRWPILVIRSQRIHESPWWLCQNVERPPAEG